MNEELPNNRLDPTVGRMARVGRPPAGQAERSPDLGVRESES